MERSIRWIRVAAVAIAIVLSTAATAQPYGIDAPRPVGPYLDGALPDAAPGAGGAWDVVEAFPNLTFRDPLQMLELPGSGKFLLVGKAGEVWTFDGDPATTVKALVLDIRPRVLQQEDGGLLGVALHPDFGTPGSNEGTLFIFYRYTPEPDYTGINAYWRLSRFTINAAHDYIDPASEFVLIQQYDRNEWHNGGGLTFGDDGYLYVSTGDEGGTNDQYDATQQLDVGFFSGLLRIDVEQDPTVGHPIRRQPQNPDTPPAGWPDSFSQGYFVPDDNPWIDPGGAVLEEFWAIGLRSPHRISYDPVTDEVWIGDVGQGLREEISVAYAGANLQWPYREGFADGVKPMPEPLIGIDQPPLYDYGPSTGRCIIGGFVYRGGLWDEELGGKYLFGDHTFRKVWALTPGDPPRVDYLTTVPAFGVGDKNGISSFATDSAGEVYVLKLFGFDTDGGKVFKLIRTPGAGEPPAKLSEMGAFGDLTTLTPAPGSGLIPYEVRSPLWSDGAVKRRWVSIPNDGSHDEGDERVWALPYEDWTFPPGTVFVKHFELPLDAADPGVVARLETRFLTIGETGEAYGVTYRWNAAQDDATLLTSSESADYTVYDEQGASSVQTWTFPSPSDCLTCHNQNGGWVRGVHAAQLNHDVLYPVTGITDNQLRTWNHLGILRPALRETQLPELPVALPLDHPTYDRAHRLQSYLDANCAQCHRPGSGVNAMFDARLSVPLELQGLVGGALVGSYPPGSAVIEPGDLEASILYQRLSSTDADRMPPLGVGVVHDEAVGLFGEWIGTLTPATPLCDNRPLPLKRDAWALLYVDSEEAEWPASAAIDGDPTTFWHTEWQASDPPHPHELQFDLGAPRDLAGMTYLPRQDSSPNGTVEQFEVYVSDDPGDWGSPVLVGTHPTDRLESRFEFQATGRYVRFVALSEQNGAPWTTIAELYFLKAPCASDCDSPGAVAGLTLADDGAATSLAWTTGGGAGVEFDVIRVSDPADLAAPDCVESRDTDFSALDTDGPRAGEAYYYLVRGVDGCSGAVASAGFDGDGAARHPGLCPIE